MMDVPTSPTEQSGLWKSLWSYVVGPKQPVEASSPPPSTTPPGHGSSEAIAAPPRKVSLSPEVTLPPTPPTRQPPPAPQGTFYSSWVSSMQLSLWDNIFGPQVVKSWPGVEQLEPDLQMHLARQVLSGEIGRIDAKGERVERSLHVLPEVDFVVSSALFSAVYKGHQNTKFALSLLLRRSKHLHLYLQLQTIIADRLIHLVTKYCTALVRDPANALTFLNSQAATLASNLEGLYSALLPRIAFSDTHLYHGSHGIDFVARATTAMLQTGSAVVYGPREDDVNTRRRSALAADGREYVPDLVLQGLVILPPGARRTGDDQPIQRKVSEEQLLTSLLPTAIVDLQSLQVKRMHPYNEYVVLRKEFRELELERLFNRLSRQRNLAEFSQQSLFTPVKKAAPCILSLLQEAQRLDKHLREQHVQHAVMCLNRKAAVLVAYVEAELASADENATMDTEAIERMRENLDLQVDEDYFVVLSLAEGLSPGIYCKVERNPELLPELIQELFESF